MQLQRESPAPAGSRPEQLWNNAASSCAGELLWLGCALQQAEAALRVLSSSKRGRAALPALVKPPFGGLFLLHQKRREQTLLLLLKGRANTPGLCSLLLFSGDSRHVPTSATALISQ